MSGRFFGRETLPFNGMGDKSVTNHGGVHTNKLNAQTNKHKQKQLFEMKNFSAEVFGGKMFYYFGTGEKL